MNIFYIIYPPHFVNNFLSHISDTLLKAILLMKNFHKLEIQHHNPVI
jgi:hypothetical protein